MADFKAGDRVVKMSGFSAGKYGTVNSVLENGTLNVTFDGERLPKYCDPMRCGSVAANAVEFTNPNYRPEAGMRFLDENFSMFDPKVAKAMIEDARRKGVKVPPGVIEKARRAGLISNAVRNERIRAFPDGPGEWILVDAVGDEGIGRTTATDERGIKAQLADIAVKTYRWHRPEIVIMREKYYSNAANNAVARNGSIDNKLIQAEREWDMARSAKDIVRWNAKWGSFVKEYDDGWYKRIEPQIKKAMATPNDFVKKFLAKFPKGTHIEFDWGTGYVRDPGVLNGEPFVWISGDNGKMYRVFERGSEWVKKI